MNVTIFGSGYVGLVTGACLANLGHDVLCMDVDKKKIDSLLKENIPFYEPGLKETVASGIQKKRLRFTTDPKEAVEFGSVLFNCVGTPGKDDGSANLDYIFDVAKNIAQHINGYKVIVTKSTVPPGTARKINDFIKKQNQKASFDVVSNPEFLKEGSAVHDFNHPDRIVVGIKEPNSPAKKHMDEIYAGLKRSYIELIYTSWETAELIKYASNTFLAMKVSFINEIANICEMNGADVKVVAHAMGLDPRIGQKFLNAGVGYGGSCFPKDVRALDHYAKSLNYETKLIKSIDVFNEEHKSVIIKKIKKSMGSLKGKTIAIWGLSFKPKTSDVRESPSITIIEHLVKEGATIKAYDPESMEEAKKIIKDVAYEKDPYAAAANTDAVVLVTEWDEFRTIDLKKVRESMKGNKLFDGRNIFGPQAAKNAGFDYHGIGR